MADFAGSLPAVGRTLEALQAMEASHVGPLGRAVKFAWRGTWLVRLGYLMSPPLLALGPLAGAKGAGVRIPGLGRAHSLRLLINFDGLHHLASASLGFQFKIDGTRMRAFLSGPEGMLCIKAVANGSDLATRTRQELAIRAQLKEFGHLRLPRIERVEDTEHYLFLFEEFINGRRFSGRRDAGLFIDKGLPQLVATYLAHGVSRRPLSDALASDFLPALETIPAPAAFISHTRGVVTANPLVSFSLCHGDLLPSNICIRRGEVIFIDFDRAGEGVLAFDLFRLLLKYPRIATLQQGVTAALRHSFEMQPQNIADLMAVYLAQAMIAQPQRTPAFINIWQRFWR